MVESLEDIKGREARTGCIYYGYTWQCHHCIVVGKRNIIPENKDKGSVKRALETATPLEDPSLLYYSPGQA